MNKSFAAGALLAALIILSSLPQPAHARHVLDAGTNLSFWWTIYEENENGIRQMGSQDPAADVTSGFSIRQARVVLYYEDTDHNLGAMAQVRLEENVSILDFYGVWKPRHYFNLYVGQMKIPSTYEVLASDAELDFITRSSLSMDIADWALSRTPYQGYGAFKGIHCYNRDVGIGIKGSIGPRSDRRLVRYFLMVSNGLGAGIFIGGKEKKGFIYSNDFGDYFYGARLDVSPKKWLTLGGHYSYNRHDNMLFNDEKSVYDLNRYSWSADLRVKFPLVRITGMYGGGKVDEDFFDTGLDNMEYSGWEVKGFVTVWKEHLELGVRYDAYINENNENGDETQQNNWTFGINFMPISAIRIQTNYIIKKTESDYEPDFDDNIFFVNFQYRMAVRGILGGRSGSK